jgi:hypothetical protein
MHIHLPKPLHGWREFLGEIGVIVIGILIALGLEQAIAGVEDRRHAHEARDAIDAEMRENLQRIATHLNQSQCNERRLDQIASLLAGWKSGKALPSGLSIGDPGDQPLVEQRWQANLNSGRFSQQSPTAQAQQAAFYTQIGILNTILDREHTAWSRLRMLEMGPVMLSVDMRPGLVEALANARTDARDAKLLGQEVLRVSRPTLGSPEASRASDLMGTSCGPLLPSGRG